MHDSHKIPAVALAAFMAGLMVALLLAAAVSRDINVPGIRQVTGGQMRGGGD